MSEWREWQWDGLVGPTHNYAGLAVGNLAASKNAGAVSNPRAAALQGLEKMRFVRNLGVPQAFFPPRYRPMISDLKRFGFSGSNAMILEAAYRDAPTLLASVYSSSFMWAANAATVTPSCDAADGKLHLTPANLVSHFHRTMEAESTYRLLQKIFHNKNHHFVHNYLLQSDQTGDEGAANHMLVSYNNKKNRRHIFVYGKSFQSQFPARQKRLASESIARLHGIKPSQCLYLQQAPEVINQGVFHNDVIAMNTGRVMIAHADAFIAPHRAQLQQLKKDESDFIYREVTSNELTVADAVSTYFFNSQLLEIEKDLFVLVAPIECEESRATRSLIDRLIDEEVIHRVHFLDVRESMRNGGGPACLRLRVQMTRAESDSVHQGVVLTDACYADLVEWVTTGYRDRLCFDDLRNPNFIVELEGIYNKLESLIKINQLYNIK